MIFLVVLLVANEFYLGFGASVNVEQFSTTDDAEVDFTQETSSCPEIPCPDGFACVGRVCEDLCASVECEANETCLYGQCYVNGTFRTCDDIVCYSGQECYYNQINCLLPPCPPLPTCRSNKTDRCQERGCSSSFFCDPDTGDCIPKTEIRCDTVKCSQNSICVLGKCQPIDPCATILCAEGFECSNGLCKAIDLCAGVRCNEGTHCVSGKCEPNKRDCAIMRCSFGCVDGKCVTNEADLDLCATVRCRNGFRCVNGKCEANNSDLCAVTLCLENTTCFNGECLPNGSFKTCDNVKCKSGYQCVLEQVFCLVAPCPPIPTCKRITQTDAVRINFRPPKIFFIRFNI